MGKGYGMNMIHDRQKKKNIGKWLLCVFCTVALLGCGSRGVEGQKDTAADVVEVQDGNTAEVVEMQNDTASDKAEMSAFETIGENGALTEEELAQWTNYVNSRENNAFLLSYYDEPKQIDLNELFYSGCGLNMEDLTEKEVQE